jgi:hypothetical protein
MGLLRWILEKCVLYGFVFAVFYVIGSFFGIVPEPIKDFVSWLSQNFVFIALTVCVLAVCYTAIRLSSRREANE